MRRGFTLMEVLVSVMIFSVVSIAMISVLVGAVRIFRSGESARAAQDDAMTVIAQLDDDLNHMVPPGDGGFLYLRQGQYNTAGGGSFADDPLRNMILAFKIRNPDQQGVSRQVITNAIANSADSDSIGAHLIVCWFVKDGWLNRTTAVAADSDGSSGTTNELTVTANALGVTGHMSANCLYFGADVSLDQPLTPGGVSVRPGLDWTGCLPENNDKFCTELDPSTNTFQPFPRALRISLTMTGGSRHFTQGNVIGAVSSGGIRTTGIAQFPVGTGGIARLITASNDAAEWIHFDQASSGVLTLNNARPASIRRSTQLTTLSGASIQLAPTYCVTRTLPR